MSEGRVYLVGAGPGDPELLTLKGLRLLRDADVVVYDRLIDKRLLDHCKPGVELVDVGKLPGELGSSQSRISSLLVEKAREGKRVVRLKGGDPFVFGRGGEEAEALRDAGVSFEISPGVTSATAVPSYAGIPLTHRDHASAFTVITASVARGREDMRADWSVIARMPGTLVILMGSRQLAEIADDLIAAGKPKDTPAVVVSWGTTVQQKSASGSLNTIAEVARRAGLGAPAAIVVGEVARLHDRLNWYEEMPLFGRRIVVTRTRAQAGRLSARLADLGAHVLEIPAIEVQRLDDFSDLDLCLRSLADFDWIVFTSANAVRAVCDRLIEIEMDIRAFHGLRVAVVGKATASALLARGVRADLVPSSAVSRRLGEELVEQGIAGRKALLPRSEIASEELPRILSAGGAVARHVDAYRTAMPEGSREIAREAFSEGVDAVTFASSSSVNNMLELLDGDASCLSETAVACIGPVTAEAASERGLKVDIVAKEATIASLTGALVEYFSE